MSSGARAEAPREVRLAALALWIVATLYAVSGLLTILSRDLQIDDLQETSSLTDAEIEQSVTLGIVISVVFAFAIAALAMISAVNAPRGRRWARVSGTVVASMTAAFSLLRIVAGGPTALLSLIVLLASVAAIVLLYRRPSSIFFAAPSRSPR